MATLKVLAVRDRAVDSFGRPIFVLALGQGTRSFANEINSPQSEFNKNPEDFDLYHIGDYDDVSGTLYPCTPLMIAIGKDLVIKA